MQHVSVHRKYLLCRPHGGLNDTLCQIEKCWRYALKFNRALIIDTRLSGLHGNFSKFFEFAEPSPDIFLEASDDILKALNGLACFPEKIRGEVHRLDLGRNSSRNIVLRSDPSVPLTFDFSKHYQQALLVHEQCGGGTRSFEILDRLHLSANSRPIILNRINQLGETYRAVHVRNTDLKSDYETLFRQIAREVHGKRILICSDDTAVISHARAFFQSSEILTSSDIPDTNGRALHCFGNREENAVDAIVDLIALGSAEKLYCSVPLDGPISGFSRLAMHLCKNKYVIQNLLQLSETKSKFTTWQLTQYRRRLKNYIEMAYIRARYFRHRANRLVSESRD